MCEREVRGRCSVSQVKLVLGDESTRIERGRVTSLYMTA